MSGGLALVLLLRLAGAASAQPGPGGVPPPPGPEGTSAQPTPDGAPAQPQAGGDASLAGPQPQAPTRATVVSTTSQQWDVAIDGEPVCSTPCSLQLFPLQVVMLRSQERRAVLLDIGRLPPGDLLVSGKPFERGKYAGGIVATSLGGMAAVVGITLGSIGLAKGRDGMTTAGLISGAVGGASILWGIYLMLDAVPKATISGAAPYASAAIVGVGRGF